MPDLTPWSLQNCGTDEERRKFLISFWLAAPYDHIQQLWSSALGEHTKRLILSLNKDHVFLSDEVVLRSEIGNKINEIGLKSPSSHGLMIANFLLSPPGLLKINNVTDFFPKWLIDVYFEISESSVGDQNNASLGSETTINNPQGTIVSEDSLESIMPDFGQFPEAIDQLLENRIQLNRLLGLSNLFYIDPDDEEIKSELLVVRTALAKAILSADEVRLEDYWSSDLGDRYWSLVRSGIQSQELSDEDVVVKNSVVAKLNPDQGGGFGTDGAINAFLVAMMYFLPGSMRVDDYETKVPQWLIPQFHQIFMVPLTK